MRRQWALTTLSTDNLNQPIFVIEPPSTTHKTMNPNANKKLLRHPSEGFLNDDNKEKKNHSKSTPNLSNKVSYSRKITESEYLFF